VDLVSRSVWFSAGVAFGVYGFVKAKRTAQTLTPSGLLARAAAARAGARVFSDAVVEGMRERESELRDRGTADHRPQLDAAPSMDGSRHLEPAGPPPGSERVAVDGHR
jgi:hypothetical protein